MNKIEKIIGKLIDKNLILLGMSTSKKVYYFPLNDESHATEIDYIKYDKLQEWINEVGEKIYIFLAENNVDVYEVQCFLCNDTSINISINAEDLHVTYLYKNICKNAYSK